MRGLIGCYTSISMNIPAIANVAMMQRCKRCTFDSPGLTSESAVYPGSFAVSGNNAVGVVLLIAQGRLTPTLGYVCSEEFNAVGVVRFLRGILR